MQVTKKELKKNIYDFNSVSNRLLQSDSYSFLAALQRFLDFINSCELIRCFIAENLECVSEYEMEEIGEEIDKIASSYGRYILQLSGNINEEVKYIYNLLTYILDKKIPFNSSFFIGFSSSSKYDDKIKGFNEKNSKILIGHIEDYLTKVGIDMGMDENAVYNISYNQGQVNISNDNSVITATQNIHNTQIVELDKYIEQLLGTLKELSSVQDKCDAEENVAFIKEEIRKEKPRKTIITACIDTLKEIAAKVPTAVGFAANVAGIASLVLQICR